MRGHVHALLVLLVALWSTEAAADANHENLQEEHMLHPLDSFTAHTYAGGEWSWNLPVGPVPIGWMWWGITDWLTVELDLEANIGGVPSVNARFKLLEQRGALPAVAYETMFQYLHRDVNLLEDYEFMDVIRRGASWYNRINLSWRITNAFSIHASAGVTFSEELTLENLNRMESAGRRFENLVSPDASVAVDWRPLRWLSVHTAVSYGTTFVYLDNVPRKEQIATGMRIAPFIGNDFWLVQHLRAELSFLVIRFRDADEIVAGPVPYVYWQWGG
jgi:hypothetical protein